MIRQICIERGWEVYDDRESLGKFVEKVTKKANKIKGEILNIQYLRNQNRDCSGIIDTAIIVYKTK